MNILSIPGHPLVLKNSKQIIVVNGRRIIKSNPRVEAYQHRAVGMLVEQWLGKPAIEKPINLSIYSYGAWKRAGGNIPDASNLYQLPEDLLQAAGVIVDDRQIESHDGSRRICMCDTCEERPILKSGANKGKRKPDCGAVKQCPFERVVIQIVDVA